MTLAGRFLGQTSEQVPLEKDPSKQPTVTEQQPFTLLFVDDEPSVLSALKRVFRNESYRILTASNGAEALQLLEKEPVQLILSDHRMTGMTGAELLTAIRQKWPETIRLMLTGYADVQSIMGAVESGAVFKFLTKPWIDEDLRVTVARGLDQYRLQKEVRALRAQNLQQEERIKSFSSLFRQESLLLASLLLRHKKITKKQHDEAVSEHRKTSDLMYSVLLRKGMANERLLMDMLQESLKIKVADLSEVQASPAIAVLLPAEFCRENLLLPLKLNGQELTIAMADPSDILKRDNLELVTGLRIKVVLATGSQIEKKIEQVYGVARTTVERPRDPIDTDIDVEIEEEEDADVSELLRSSEIPSVVRIVNAMFAEALNRGASDIHIEPKLKNTLVRFRVDGLLSERMQLPAEIHNGITSRIKILAKLDITERRKPQDGRITLSSMARLVDLRVSIIPTLYGEKAVLRLLDRGAAIKQIEDLGLEEENLKQVRVVAHKPQGIIICTGPTGAGKTTTLYSLLREHQSPSRNYGTIEDPVEYYMEGASQVHINEKVGLTFPVALRSMLRQDPDVILIGEMRDMETARTAFQASMTGHLVFSTLHTNNAVSAITRLVDIDVARFLIASGLECVVAQRLLRSTCPWCHRLVKADTEELRLLSLSADEVSTQQRGTGCNRCRGTGYLGRVGIFEVLIMTDDLRERIVAGARESELAEVAKNNGMKSLFEDAMVKVHRGQTTLEEILRVLGPRLSPNRPCLGCKAVLDPSFNICPACGFVVRLICDKCSTRLVDGWKYCPSCGGSNHVKSQDKGYRGNTP